MKTRHEVIAFIIIQPPNPPMDDTNIWRSRFYPAEWEPIAVEAARRIYTRV